LGVVVILAVASGGCWFKKNKKPLPVPPPPAPQAQPARPPAPAPVPQKPAAQQPVPESAPTEPQVVAPAPKKHKAKPAQPAPATAAPAPESTPQAVPQLGVLMTPEQRQRYEADYAASLARAQHGLVLAAEYKLTPAQSEAVGRIKSFMQLAANVHDRDPATAAQLAHRAGLLAEDLLKTLQ
jgi:outer membrane biosynthesis protein TonB